LILGKTLGHMTTLCLDQWFPTFFDAFLLLLISQLFIPPLWNIHSSPVWVRKLINYCTIGTMVIIDNIDLIKARQKLFVVK